MLQTPRSARLEKCKKMQSEAAHIAFFTGQRSDHVLKRSVARKSKFLKTLQTRREHGCSKNFLCKFSFDTGIFTSPWSACLYGYLPAGQGLPRAVFKTEF